jgi:hypothetical protein
MSNDGDNISCNLGCIPLVITICVLWFLLFGLTWDGTHYDLNCSCSRGVELERHQVPR